MLLRITFALFTHTIFCPYYLTNGFSGFKLTSYDGKRIEEGNCFQNITEGKMSNCFQHCLSNCLCTSFQMCGSTCLLYSGDEGRQGPLLDQDGCSYFNFTAGDEKIVEQQCERGCNTGINCCFTSQPCFNGGTCVPQHSTVNKSRFSCHCTKYFTGNRCQDCVEGYAGRKCETRIKSCRGYKNRSQIAKTYKVFGGNNNLYSVKCDFDKNSKQAWTLVQSFKFENHDSFKWSMVKDKPVRQGQPDFNKYRLSKFRMREIAEDSSKWRITCNYIEGQKISHTDYVEASFDKVDILTFNGNRCVEVDYIDIRGHNCANCSAYMVQSHNKEVNRYYMGLHFDSSLAPKFSCDHNATKGCHYCGKSGEDNFGFFDCFSKKHRCSANNDSLTSTWFGG